MPELSIRKRNGSIVPFDLERIFSAIHRAFLAVSPQCDVSLVQRLSEKVLSELERYPEHAIPSVEEVQDLIEHCLMQEHFEKVAKAFILYRDQHRQIREGQALVLDIGKTMEDYLHQSDWRVHENSSMHYSVGGLILHNAGAITANYWLSRIYDEKIAQAHKNGDFHLHDLSMFSGYCAGWSLRQLLELGVSGVEGKVGSKPAKHFSTAIWHIINFLGTMQNEWAGAQALSSFDTYLAPFVKQDHLTFEQVKQCIQSFVFSMNTSSRWGSQPPFSNITLDWVCPKDLADKKVIVGGKECDFCYKDCQKEIDMINRAFLEVMLEGDANGRGFAYPIPTYNITKDFNWEGENADLLFTMAAKYGTPYFQNFINSDLNPSDVRSMCCRLSLDKRELRRRGGGLFGADEFTGSIGVVTINMPRLGYLSTSEAEFFQRLDTLMDLAKDSLECKRKVIQSWLDQGLFPYTKRYLHTFNNHFSTIGLVGMHECCLNFLHQSIASEAGHAFVQRVLLHMRDRLRDYQEKTGNLYNLEATPAEGTSYRLAKIDKKMFPEMIQSGSEDPYYTNSSNLPVDYTSNVFEALEHQEEIQTKYTGGTVFHVFLGEALPDALSCRTLVRKIVSNYRVPYVSISPTFSVCGTHGRFEGQVEHCPKCGAEMEIYSRITGYYRAVKFWNKGKKEEFKQRLTYDAVHSHLPFGKNDATAGMGEAEAAGCETKQEEPMPAVQQALFFHSDSCVKCRALKPFLAEKHFNGTYVNTSETSGLELAKRYHIHNLPALVVPNRPEVVYDSEEIKRYVSAGS
ncbi:MAG: ribonucleoside triphosphate reductase [Opitutales bacterium]|nr:ribonucleoside triphosphate reductase [Opitutales bacterium]